MPKKHEPVLSPSHYTAGKIETIDFISDTLGPAGFQAYCKGNALKYITRAGKKGDHNTDIMKAITYLHWAMGDDPREGK